MRSDTALAGLLSLLGALGAAEAASQQLIERVLADVNGTPILLSDVQLLETLREVSRQQALEALIEESLMYQEASRLPQAAVTPDDEERALASLRARPAAAGLEAAALRRRARRETAILKYVSFRFEAQLVGREAGAAALDQRIEEWVSELRGAAEVRYNP